MIIKKLESKFKMRNLGLVSRILKINVQRDKNNKEIILDQKDYVESILRKFNMEKCNPVKTPLDINQKLTKDMEPKNESEANAMKNIPYKEKFWVV